MASSSTQAPAAEATAMVGEEIPVEARPGRRALPALVWLGFLAGALVLAYTFSYAAVQDAGQGEFTLFWLGVFVFSVPAFLRLCAAEVPRAERLAIVAAIGVIDYLPKYLRSPASALFHDEHAHSRQAEVIASAGEPFVPNPVVPIIEFFPGLHTLNVWVEQLTGLSQFEVHVVLIALLHAVALVGVFLIAESAFESARIGGLAAFIYSINPSFMWFNSQNAYESLAIVFFIWVVVAFLRLEAADHPRLQGGWFIVGFALVGACVVTHHLTSYFMVATLVLGQALIALGASRAHEERRTARVTGAFVVAALVATVAWLVLVASRTVGYLAPHLIGAINEIVRLIYREEQARVLFERSTAPGYEKLSAYLSPLIMGLALVAGLYLLWRRRPHTSGLLVLAVLALGFFASLPVMLTDLGVEGAVRTWAFSYLGLAVLVAPVIPATLRLNRPPRPRLVLAALTAAAAIVLVGNTTMHMNVEYRFPGPYVYGSDTRSLTAELIGTTRWFRTTYGAHQNVVTDRYTGLAFASFGLNWWARPSPTFPAWDLFFQTRTPDPDLLRGLRDSDFRYLVVDERMARFVPRVGAYFLPGGGEPGADPRERPVPLAALTKFERLPWTIKVYESDHLSIYRINYAALDLNATNSPSEAR